MSGSLRLAAACFSLADAQTRGTSIFVGLRIRSCLTRVIHVRRRSIRLVFVASSPDTRIFIARLTMRAPRLKHYATRPIGVQCGVEKRGRSHRAQDLGKRVISPVRTIQPEIAFPRRALGAVCPARSLLWMPAPARLMERRIMVIRSLLLSVCGLIVLSGSCRHDEPEPLPRMAATYRGV